MDHLNQNTYRRRVARRLAALGPYKIGKDTVRFASQMHQQKYRIVNTETREIVLGKGFTATLEECEAFAEDPRNGRMYKALKAIESMPAPTISLRCDSPDTAMPIAHHPDYSREMQEARSDGIMSERRRCEYIARWWAIDVKNEDERNVALGIANLILEMEGYPAAYYSEKKKET